MEISKEYILSLEQKLQHVLNPKRYLHTLGVAYMSASLAMCHGISHREALVAGLLHDCAKDYSDQELLENCIKNKVPITTYEQNIPQLLHAPYGAYLAMTEYEVSDTSIINAIRYHTVGRPAMTPLEQIVFLADYLEPERNQPTVPCLDELRKIAFQNMNEATYLVAKNTLQYFESTGKEVDPAIYEVFRYYKENREEGLIWNEQN